MSNKKPAIFLDRDGVINKDNGYISQVDDFEFIEGTIEACIEFQKKGYQLVVITDQPGIATGHFTEAQFNSLTEWMDWSMADRGVELDGIYYCPHYSIEEGKGGCECQKPKPGMLLNAIEDLNIEIETSILIGDSVFDLQAGIAAGVKTNYLVRSGIEVNEEAEALATDVFDNLAVIARTI